MVNIGVTILTTAACAGHGYRDSSVGAVLLRVASAARDGLMLAVECEFGGTVVKAYLLPAILDMAPFAAAPVDVLPHLAFMCIEMAGKAACRFVPEYKQRVNTACDGLYVADQTRLRSVRAAKGIIGLVMLGYREFRG